MNFPLIEPLYLDIYSKNNYERLIHKMEEETEHADAIIERMLFFEAQPDFNQ